MVRRWVVVRKECAVVRDRCHKGQGETRVSGEKRVSGGE